MIQTLYAPIVNYILINNLQLRWEALWLSKNLDNHHAPTISYTIYTCL